MLRLRLFWLLCLLPLNGLAADAGGNYTVLSMGNKPCTTYIVDYDAAGWERLVHSVWVGGYLTAVNSYSADGVNLSRSMGPEQRETWIYQYCQAHAEHTLDRATRMLLQHLREIEGIR